MSKVTPWIPVRMKPLRDGWYEYYGPELFPGRRYYWAGNQWGFWDAGGSFWQLATTPKDQWRGLKEPAT